MTSTPTSVIDSHCHLDDARFDGDRRDVLERARAAGVESIVVPGVDPRTWSALGPLRDAHAQVHVAIGVHPIMLPRLEAHELVNSLDHLSATAKALRAIAIGEVGFDGGIEKMHGVRYEAQTRVVDAHVEVAKQLDLPLILHVHRAHEVGLRSLARHAPLRGVVHSYSGSAELVTKWLRLGLHLSFAGGITRPEARRPLEALRVVPDDRLLVETDAPDQTPTGASTTRCEPAQLVLNLEAMARARGTSYEAIARLTSDNARSLFRIG